MHSSPSRVPGAISPDLEPVRDTGEKARLIILADMGHDPDEEQQISHLLICSNRLDIEGLIAVTGRFFRPNPTERVKTLRPHLFHYLIDGYAVDYPNLKLHAGGWPDPEYLRGIVARGQEDNGVADTGVGKSSAGSKLIVDAVDRRDPRPIHIIINSGANTLAQALFDVRATRSEEEVAAFVSKLRVYENSGQDDAGPWILNQFPSIHWIKAVQQNRCYGGPSNKVLGPHVWAPFPYSPEGQHAWATVNIQTRHGALGSLYCDRVVYGRNSLITHYIEGGGTIPFMGLVARGLDAFDYPWWGGWSGRYSRERRENVLSHFPILHEEEKRYFPFTAYSDESGISDTWTDPVSGESYDSVYAATWRWRRAMWNDFKCRMDWAVQPYDRANHHPVAAVGNDVSDSILKAVVRPGQALAFDASDSEDPDGDPLVYSWFIYTEAGTYSGAVPLTAANSEAVSLTVPKDASGTEIHLILDVSDRNPIASLHDYRRVVLEVE